jgi:hypothetical protein
MFVHTRASAKVPIGGRRQSRPLAHRGPPLLIAPNGIGQRANRLRSRISPLRLAPKVGVLENQSSYTLRPPVWGLFPAATLNAS